MNNKRKSENSHRIQSDCSLIKKARTFSARIILKEAVQNLFREKDWILNGTLHLVSEPLTVVNDTKMVDHSAEINRL